MEWEFNFDQKTLRRGKALQRNGGVLELKFDEEINELRAAVVGSYASEYGLVIEFYFESEDWVELETFCSCPVGRECKHAAAAMYEFVQGNQVRVEKTAPGRHWLSAVAAAAQAPVSAEVPALKPNVFLVYVLTLSIERRFPVMVEFKEVRRLKSGGWGKPKNAVQDFGLLVSKDYLSDEDRRLLMELYLLAPQSSFRQVALNTAKAVSWLEDAVKTGRCCWKVAGESTVLSPGDARAAELGWAMMHEGLQRPALVIDGGGACEVLPLEHPCYVDATAQQLGRLTFDVPAPVAREWLNGMPVPPKDVPDVLAAMGEILPKSVSARPPSEIEFRTVEGRPVPCLTLHTVPPSDLTPHYFQTGTESAVHAAHVEFLYDDVFVEAADRSSEVRRMEGDQFVCVKRDLSAEEEALKVLGALGFRLVRKACYWVSDRDPIANWLTLPDEADFLRFMADGVSALESAGWTIRCDASFELNLIEPESWYLDLEENSSGTQWFDTELGVVVDGQKENLLPVLLEFLRQVPSKSLSRHLEDDVLVTLADGRRLQVPAERMRVLASTLLELFSKEPLSKEKTVSIPWVRALELLRMDDLQDMERRLPDVLSENLQRFCQLNDLPAVELPMCFDAELRSYQLYGLSWLQFLREMNLGGVLADDMGLGKTIQALAHIQLEKEAGRLTAPALVVAPTSVLYNWESESARFAPDLRVHVSHGPERSEFFDSFCEYDLIVTSYPLLVRDGKHFTEHPFHVVFLDEAQYVRNHKTQAARIVRLLSATQRIALTGTPLENNLDELWSIFSFTVPGLLGDNPLFRKLFRTPIEKGGNTTARHLLAQRIAPFMLRRTKTEVVHELPPKTEMIQRVELSPAQKDLYETVRVSVEKKVRKSIEEKGAARSHIIVLDALLKMRQVCCHPQLLKLKAAEKVTDSAKFDALRDMVVEMAAEGRRILLFSQFVSMLKLIEQMLAEENIEYVKITGQTKDRKTPVAEFQTGTVPVFLISLKAGGTGLNLTAADTVIHFDPWWNPAAESQATDRAYRIGQDKPVFVYKLIAAGTVEEKIVELQDKKKALIDGLLSDRKEILEKWNEDDLDSLFAPLVEE